MGMEWNGMKSLNLSMIMVIMMISILTLFHGAGAGAPKLDPATQKICDATPNPKVCCRSLSYAGKGDQGTPDASAVLEARARECWDECHTTGHLQGKKALEEDAYIPKEGSSYYADSIQVCLDSYDSATDSWNSALASLKAKRGFDVANDLTSVSSMVMSCEDAFMGGDPTVVNDSPLARIDRLILKMTSNALKLREMMMYEEASQVANDAVGSIRTVASFCAEEKMMELYGEKCEGLVKTGIRQGLISGFGLSCVYATIFYAGARPVFFGLTMATMGISQSSSFAPDSTQAKTAAASIVAILDQKSKIDPTLVGESGNGKSTMIALLQRFYSPDSGHITLDGVEIQRLQLKWVRQQMALISQEPLLLNDTIRSNIAYTKEGHAAEAEILAASELANSHKFISGLQQARTPLS
ncbi:P-glycoprotein 3 [Actinidia rufa]|uniref:p-glycoprotein 3 n=1 Tax=Actinidia rufa TaxID=165716 RepID=A0A7J0FIV6_9ERIC|nr:P-glycoprotein 3 [Actinidia rufa]